MKNNYNLKNRGYSIIILIILLSFLIPMFFNDNIYINTIFFISSIIIMFYFGLNIKTFIKTSLLILPVTFTIIIMNIIFPNKEILKNFEKVNLFGFSFYKDALINGLIIFFKLFAIGVISICSISLIDIFEFFYILMKHFGLSKKIAYPFFISINSIYNTKEEYERILIARKLRKIKNINIFTLMLPLLVFAVRFSERSAISLVSKGFNENIINFYFDEGFDKGVFKRTIFFFFAIELIFFTILIFY